MHFYTENGTLPSFHEMDDDDDDATSTAAHARSNIRHTIHAAAYLLVFLAVRTGTITPDMWAFDIRTNMRYTLTRLQMNPFFRRNCACFKVKRDFAWPRPLKGLHFIGCIGRIFPLPSLRRPKYQELYFPIGVPFVTSCRDLDAPTADAAMTPSGGMYKLNA